MTVKDALLEKYIKFKMNQANKHASSLFGKEEVEKYHGRTLGVKLIDLGDNVGFGFDYTERQFVELDRLQNPTILAKCTSRVMRAFLAGRLTPEQIFYGGLAEIDGEYILRDKVILTEFFQRAKDKGIF